MSEWVSKVASYLSELDSGAEGKSLPSLLRRAIVEGTLQQLSETLESIPSGAVSCPEPTRAFDLVERVNAAHKMSTAQLFVSEIGFSRLGRELGQRIVRLIESVFADPRIGNVRVATHSVLRIADASELLELCTAVRRQSVEVMIDEGQQSATKDVIFQLHMVLPTREMFVLVGEQRKAQPQRITWTLKMIGQPVGPADGLTATPEVESGERFDIVLDSVLSRRPVADPIVNTNDTRRSVADLFGENIVLRDLEPRCATVKGLDAIRSSLGFNRHFTPRKNEREYAAVLNSFLIDLVPDGVRDVLYVGDTLLNDGSAIRNLAKLRGTPVFGLLCNPNASYPCDFIIGSLYFGRHWHSVVPFLAQCLRDGVALDKRTVAFFDLDQTVYAAKGRDDEPLKRARWEAILAFLSETVGTDAFDVSRAEAIYREFDQDAYHAITRDNMDYVVLLVLAVAARLCDSGEVRELTRSEGGGIASLTEELYRRASHRQDQQQLERVMEVIRAVYYNTLVGDQTPCKDFRKYECRYTAERMQGAGGDSGATGRICLNREVVEFIDLLSSRGCTVVALSDRPPEAAATDEDGVRWDVTKVKMQANGDSVLKPLHELTWLG